MRKRINEAELVGQEFGLLTIKKAWRNSKSAIILQCLCECGRYWQGSYATLRSSHTKSCGCAFAKTRNKSEWQKFKINPAHQ